MQKTPPSGRRAGGAQTSPPITTARRLARCPPSTPPSAVEDIPVSRSVHGQTAFCRRSLRDTFRHRETSESGDACRISRRIHERSGPVAKLQFGYETRRTRRGSGRALAFCREYYASRARARINAPERVYADSSFSREERRVRPQHLRPNRIGGDAGGAGHCARARRGAKEKKGTRHTFFFFGARSMYTRRVGSARDGRREPRRFGAPIGVLR